jgi:hypothetical protein
MELEVKHLEDEIREHIEIFYEGQGFLGNLSSEDEEVLVKAIMTSVRRCLGIDNEQARAT